MLDIVQTRLQAVGLVLVTLWVSQPAFAADATSSDEAKRLYDQNCAMCHQADAIGKPGFAPSLTNKEFLSISSDKFIASTIRDGRVGTGMPPFAHLGKPINGFPLDEILGKTG